MGNSLRLRGFVPALVLAGCLVAVVLVAARREEGARKTFVATVFSVPVADVPSYAERFCPGRVLWHAHSLFVVERPHGRGVLAWVFLADRDTITRVDFGGDPRPAPDTARMDDAEAAKAFRGILESLWRTEVHRLHVVSSKSIAPGSYQVTARDEASGLEWRVRVGDGHIRGIELLSDPRLHRPSASAQSSTS